MKIPKSIVYQGRVYTTEFVKTLNNGTDLCYGHINFENSLIQIEPDIQDHQGQCITYLHELTHLIFQNAGINLDEVNIDGTGKEDIVQQVAQGFYAILQDNSKKLFDLKKDEQKK